MIAPRAREGVPVHQVPCQGVPARDVRCPVASCGNSPAPLWALEDGAVHPLQHHLSSCSTLPSWFPPQFLTPPSQFGPRLLTSHPQFPTPQSKFLSQFHSQFLITPQPVTANSCQSVISSCSPAPHGFFEKTLRKLEFPSFPLASQDWAKTRSPVSEWTEFSSPSCSTTSSLFPPSHESWLSPPGTQSAEVSSSSFSYPPPDAGHEARCQAETRCQFAPLAGHEACCKAETRWHPAPDAGNEPRYQAETRCQPAVDAGRETPCPTIGPLNLDPIADSEFGSPSSPGSAFSEDMFSNFPSSYTLLKPLGRRSSGNVWECIENRTGERFAVKIMKGRSHSGFKRVEMEVECLESLPRHGNVVGLHEVYLEDDQVHVVMELCGGGDLFDAMSRTKTGFPEDEARNIFVQVVKGLRHCHSHGIVHRDIKPENIFLQRREDFSSSSSVSPRTVCPEEDSEPATVSVKLGDFGLSVFKSPGSPLYGCVGTEPYTAPEVKSGEGYSFSADIWSLGVLLFTILTARWPSFDCCNGLLPRNDKNWSHVSPEARSLIQVMLNPTPGHRPTADEILQHPWINRRVLGCSCGPS